MYGRLILLVVKGLNAHPYRNLLDSCIVYGFVIVNLFVFCDSFCV